MILPSETKYNYIRQYSTMLLGKNALVLTMF